MKNKTRFNSTGKIVQVEEGLASFCNYVQLIYISYISVRRRQNIWAGPFFRALEVKEDWKEGNIKEKVNGEQLLFVLRLD
jgi:hypothetical protein